MQTTHPPLLLTLRFASHLPDLTLAPIPTPSQTTALSLLPEIRRSLPPTYSSLKIILISSGRILPLRDPLSTSLSLPSTKKLGKSPANTSDPTVLRYTIHATFSLPDSALSDADLSAEHAEGVYLNTQLASAEPDPESRLERATEQTTEQATERLSPPFETLQGFDRLSAAEIGIPVEDIANLRAEFRALVDRGRGDGAPLTPMEFLVLEERWLDDADFSGEGLGALVGGGSAGLGSGGGGDVGEGSQVDDVLWGNVLGFFWPLGGLFWFVGQEGAWRERRRNSVLVGVLVNLLFCLVRVGLGGGLGG